MGSTNGDQDTENTELMAIYTKENQITEKVLCSPQRAELKVVFHVNKTLTLLV